MNDPLGATRHSLHAVAELVLAGPQHRRTGTIRLLVSPGGFRPLKHPELRVDGVDLVVGQTRLAITGRSCAELAAAAGVDVGAPRGLYDDGSGAEPDEVLHVDPEPARWLADCWAAGDAALRRVVPSEQPILWPEHFDVGVFVDGIGYGVSPGDAFLPEPYAYLTPRSPRTGAYWNAPFGVARPMRELDRADPDAVYAFFTQARDRADTDPAA
ncbi:hypothetical protein [Phytohabitans rumicis]|uniref:Uncharacterized protein n=1 Tax=Phytohabitans rumicis TaxID=1076125 RepID=A0A6V8LPA2_9ACTN|nr:hypothetical protein [Phytohabitans rumicis]GFJ95927.1 hypothetical protein Prum_095690 [Phytohabitans rumicis]